MTAIHFSNGMILRDRTALVTGAGSGIGRATALLLAKAGAKVMLVSLDHSELEPVREQIEAEGGVAQCLAGDVATPRTLETAVSQISASWGRLDVVIANAGINGLWAPLEEITPDEWERTLRVNLGGTYHSIRSSLPLLKRALRYISMEDSPCSRDDAAIR